MEKKSFVTLVLSVVGSLLFGLGMCMCLLPEWNMFNQGIGFGVVGAVVLLIAVIKHRKDTGKTPIKLDVKTVLKVIYGLFASLVFGAGMCMVMVYEGMMLQGIIVGIVGIVLLLFLVPMCFGWKNEKQEEKDWKENYLSTNMANYFIDNNQYSCTCRNICEWIGDEPFRICDFKYVMKHPIGDDHVGELKRARVCAYILMTVNLAYICQYIYFHATQILLLYNNSEMSSNKQYKSQ